VLCEIRGIGRYLALLIIAEIGAIERFPSARHLCAWAGLTPTVRSSDAKARLGHISRLGSGALRWALIEAAQRNTQRDGPLAESFERIAERRGRQIAKVAVARKSLTLCFYGLRDGEIRSLKPPGRASAMKVMAARCRPPRTWLRPRPGPPCARSGELVPMSGLHPRDGRCLD
jgi:transposase